MAHRRGIGRPMSALDGQIAVIAKSRGFTLATRNTHDFEQTAVDLINPWTTR
jgi:predicted nucleic acid-binding protein